MSSQTTARLFPCVAACDFNWFQSNMSGPLSLYGGGAGFGFTQDALVCRLDEHLCRPRTTDRPISAIVVARWPRGLYPFKSHSAMDHVRDAIAQNRDHIAVFHYIGFVAQPAMAGNYHGSAFLLRGGNGQIENPVQRVDHALETPPALQIDSRIGDRIEHVAGAHHVGAAEEDDAVAVTMGRRLVQHLHSLVV